MRYIVIEIQGTESSTATLVNDYDDINDAKSKFHSILSFAAVSDVPTHAAVILSEEGSLIKHEYFAHKEE